MDLPKELVNRFTGIVNDGRQQGSKEATVYGSVVKDGDAIFVLIDGGESPTPVSSSAVNVKDGERVSVIISNHTAAITGNLTSPAARTGDLEDTKEEITEEIDKSLDAYDIKLKQMNELAANTLGFYYTEEKTEDGAIISYRHDKPDLSESSVIYKTGIDGFFLSVDGGKTWKAGFDKNGDAVLNILYAIGIQSKWINTRGFTATDNDGNETFKIDEKTGAVYIDPKVFMLGDADIAKKIEEIVGDSSTVFMLLSNEYQAISTDADGNIIGDFPDCQTTITIMSGSNDVTSEATVRPSAKKGISSFTWDPDSCTYTVQGISADDCYVEFTAIYNDITVTRRFSITKQKQGQNGVNGTSPTITLTKKDGVTTITTTDSSGTYTQEVLDGTNGTPGKPGENGETTYFHLKFSNDGGKSFTSNNGEDPGDYMGTYTDTTKEDSTLLSDYTWVKIKGDDGEDGMSPDVSISKKDGVTTITITDKNGTHTQTVLDGTNGTPGTPGTDGKTPYFHVKYSDDGGKTFTSNSGETPGAYIGTYTDFVEADSTSLSKYTWAKIKGTDGTNGTNGKDGKGISSITVYYQANNLTSGVYTYSSGWSTSFTAPSASAKYLWTYQKTTYNDGTSETTTPHIIGTYGKDGKDGSSLTSAELWALLLQTNTDFLYKGSDGKLFIKASYIDTGNLCGFTADRNAKTLFASYNGSSATDSDTPNMLTVDLSIGGSVLIDAAHALIKTKAQYSVYGSYDGAYLQGDKVFAREARFNRLFVRDRSSAGYTYNIKAGTNSAGSYLASPAVYAYPALASTAKTVCINSNGTLSATKSSSKRYKRDFNASPELNYEAMFEVPVYTYRYNEGYFEDHKDDERMFVGVVAEDIEKVDSRLVIYDEDGEVETWDEQQMIPFLLGMIQENHKRIDELEKRLQKLESLLNI